MIHEQLSRINEGVQTGNSFNYLSIFNLNKFCHFSFLYLDIFSSNLLPFWLLQYDKMVSFVNSRCLDQIQPGFILMSNWKVLSPSCFGTDLQLTVVSLREPRLRLLSPRPSFCFWVFCGDTKTALRGMEAKGLSLPVHLLRPLDLSEGVSNTF